MNSKGKTSVANQQLKEMDLTQRINNILANTNTVQLQTGEEMEGGEKGMGGMGD